MMEGKGMTNQLKVGPVSSTNPKEYRASSLCYFRELKSSAQALGDHKLLDSSQNNVLVTAQPCTPGCIPEGAKKLFKPTLTFFF